MDGEISSPSIFLRQRLKGVAPALGDKMTETGINLVAAMIADKPMKGLVTIKKMDMTDEAVARRERAAKLRRKCGA